MFASIFGQHVWHHQMANVRKLSFNTLALPYTTSNGKCFLLNLVYTGEKYTKSYYENIMIFEEITTMYLLKIIKIMFFTEESYCIFH